MTIIEDKRKKESYRTEFLADGFFKKYSNTKNIGEYLYFGENTKIIYITKFFLINSIDELITKVQTFNIDYIPNSENLISISGPDGFVIIDGEYWYSFSEEYISLPNIKNPPPENKRINKRTQVSLSGYTLSGNPIISGGSKGLIYTENYLCRENLIPIQGILNQDGNLITSVSKSNKKIINNEVYYTVNVTIQEL